MARRSYRINWWKTRKSARHDTKAGAEQPWFWNQTGENADASKTRKEPKVYAHGGVSYHPRRDDPKEQPELDPTPSSSAVPKHMKQRQDPRLLNLRRCPDLQVPAKGHRMAGKGNQTSYIDDHQTSGDASQSSQTPINPSSSDKGRGRKEVSKVQHGWCYYREW